MKKVFAVMLVVLCVGVFAMGDVFAAPPLKAEKVNGVARTTHSGDIKGTFELDCLTNVDPAGLQVLVYVPGLSIVARPVADDQGVYSFRLFNVPAGTYEVKIDVNDVPGDTLTTLTLSGVKVEKQRVNDLGKFTPCTE